MTRKARAYLDGGPANGLVVELDEPEWAPLPALRVEVGDRELVYVRARQEAPPSGQPWRYVPKGEQPPRYFGETEGVPTDPNDD